MSHLKTKIEYDNREDNVYFNINLVNNNPFSVPCQFTETLTNDIVGNTNDYYLSIIRFSIDGGSMPIFFFKDNVGGQPLSGYWITLSYLGVNYSLPVVYDSLYTPGATSPPYNRSVYFYQAFLHMINTTFANIFIANPGVFPIGSVAPYMLFDPTTGLISLYAQSLYYADTLANPITIFFNTRLFNIFDNFISAFFSEGSATYTDQQLIITDLHGSNSDLLDPTIPAGYLKMTQEYQSLYHWWDVSLLSFKSTMLGVRPEYVPTANTTTSLSNNGAAGSGIPFQSVATDFIPDIASNDPAGFRQSLVYLPGAQYRLIDLININTKTVDLIISFKDRQSTEYQYFIPPNQSVTVKMIFVKKSLFKNK